MNQKNKIKKLKLYGKKGDFRGLIATVYVNEDNKLIIEADDSKVKKDLTHLIIAGIYGNLIMIKKGVDTPEGGHKTLCFPKKPGDPEFLEALWYSTIWTNTKVGGYQILYGPLFSKIIEE